MDKCAFDLFMHFMVIWFFWFKYGFEKKYITKWSYKPSTLWTTRRETDIDYRFRVGRGWYCIVYPGPEESLNVKKTKYPEVSFKRKFQMIRLELLLVLFPCWIGMVEMEVKCTVPSTHIIMGEILTLFCNTSEISCSSCSEQWRKGESFLSFGDTSVDTDKYTVEQQKDGFTLEIKNTTFDDFNVEYTCSYGFSSCTASPTLPAAFEYHPRRDTTEKYLSVTDRALLFEVVFKEIHPVPVCRIYLDEENLSSSAKIETLKTGYLFQVKMTLSHTVKPDQCPGRLLVNCTTGSKKDTILNDTVSFECSGGRDLTKIELSEIEIVIIALVCVAVIIGITITAYCVWKKNYLRMKLISITNRGTKYKGAMNKKKSNKNDLEMERLDFITV